MFNVFFKGFFTSTNEIKMNEETIITTPTSLWWMDVLTQHFLITAKLSCSGWAAAFRHFTSNKLLGSLISDGAGCYFHHLLNVGGDKRRWDCLWSWNLQILKLHKPQLYIIYDLTNKHIISKFNDPSVHPPLTSEMMCLLMSWCCSALLF